MQHKTTLTGISDLIHKLFESKNLTQKRNNYKVFHNWVEAVGSEIARNTEPLKFQKDLLVIKVRNSAWSQELQYLKPQLLQKIRTQFPETNIRDIAFKIGDIK